MIQLSATPRRGELRTRHEVMLEEFIADLCNGIRYGYLRGHVQLHWQGVNICQI